MNMFCDSTGHTYLLNGMDLMILSLVWRNTFGELGLQRVEVILYQR
jgi:hypothetical protein